MNCAICGAPHLTGFGKKDGDWCAECEACPGLKDLARWSAPHVKPDGEQEDPRIGEPIDGIALCTFALAKVMRYTARRLKQV